MALEKNHIRSEAANTVRSNCKLAIKRGLPVVDFVRAVWGYTPDMIPDQCGNRSYTLSRDLVNAYVEATERDAFTAFASLVTDLHAQLYPDDSTVDDFFAARKVPAVVTNTRAIKDAKMIKDGGVKPDLTWSTIQSGSQCWRSTWESCLAFVEIKRPSDMCFFLYTDLCADLCMFAEARESSQVSLHYTENTAEGEKMTIKRLRLSTSSPVEDERSLKRMCQRDSPATVKPASSSVCEVSPIDDEDFHAVLYVMEMLERNLRSYASGFAVHGTTVTLWYGDRMGLVASDRFDLLEEPHLFLLVIAALGDADEDRFGVSPYLTGASFGNFDRSGLMLPPLKARDAYGIPLEEQLVLKTYHPGVLVPGRRYVVVGAGTMIFPVKAITAESILCGEELIAKVSWPLESSASETFTLKVVLIALREKAPRYRKHITEVRCYIEESFAEHGLPRAVMLDMATESPRHFVLMVMKRYEPLHQVASPSEFRSIFMDVVRGMLDMLHYMTIHLDLCQRIGGSRKQLIYCMPMSAQTTLCSTGKTAASLASLWTGITLWRETMLK